MNANETIACANRATGDCDPATENGVLTEISVCFLGAPRPVQIVVGDTTYVAGRDFDMTERAGGTTVVFREGAPIKAGERVGFGFGEGE